MGEPRPTVALLGFLDTKGPEHAFTKDILEAQGCNVVVIDVSITVRGRQVGEIMPNLIGQI